MPARDSRGRFVKGSGARTKWFINEVTDKISLTMHQRVTIATSMLHSQMVKNISKSVGRSGGRVTSRSRPGEFPRADTTQLMKTLFFDVRKVGRSAEGSVGTPLDYGVILELHMDRSFMVRTFNDMLPTLRRIITKQIRR